MRARPWWAWALSAVLLVLLVGPVSDTPLPAISRAMAPPPLPTTVAERDARLVVTVSGGEGDERVAVKDARVLVLVEVGGRVYRAGGGYTNDHGVAYVSALPRAHGWVLAEAHGYARASTSLVLTAGERDVSLELGAEHTFAANVRDAEGRGIAGAELEVAGADALPWGARTDDHGHVEVGRLGDPPWVVTARARGYDEASARGVREGAVIELVLHRLGAIVVHVVDGAGVPVPQARVRIAGTALWPAREGHTGEHGAVRLAGLFAGSYALRATDGVRGGTRASPIELGVALAGGEEKELTLRLEPGRMVLVHVTDGEAEDADDVNGARVILAEAGLSPFPLEAVTDAHGHALLGPIAAGSASVTARADGFVARASVLVPDVLQGDVRVVLVRAGALVGRVVDARGFPIAGATLEILGNDFAGGPIDDDPRKNGFRDSAFAATLAGPGQLVPLVQGAGELGVVPGPVAPIPHDLGPTSVLSGGGSEPWVTAADGTFRAWPATPGRVRALVRHPEYVEGWSELVTIPPGGEAHVEVVLHGGGTLEGRVVDAAGRPVAGARIELAATHGTVMQSTRTATDGTFAFASVPHDVMLDVFADDADTAPDLHTTASVAEGERRELELKLPSPREAAIVRAKDDRGYALAAAQVVVSSLDPARPLRVTVFTDASGEATVRGVRGLALRLDVTASGHAPRSVTLDASPAELDVTLGRAVSVLGTVRGPHGEPVADADVVLTMPETVRHLRTDARGDFAASDLAPGDARLLVRASGFAVTERHASVPEADRPFTFGNVDLAAEAVVEGDVRDARGDPVAGARVAKDRVPVFLAATVSPGPAGVATTDARGRFRLGGLPDGTVTLEAFSPEVGRGRAEARVTAGRTTTNVRVVLAPSEGRPSDHVGATVAVTLGETGGATERDHQVVVMVVAEGSEAERMGVLVGDVIAEVDGAPVHTIEQAREKLSGPEATDVVLRIERETGNVRLRVPRERARR